MKKEAVVVCIWPGGTDREFQTHFEMRNSVQRGSQILC